MEDYLCLEESSDSDNSGIEILEESSVSEIDSEKSLDSNIGKALLEGEDDEENVCKNSSDLNFELKRLNIKMTCCCFIWKNQNKMKIQ